LDFFSNVSREANSVKKHWLAIVVGAVVVYLGYEKYKAMKKA